MVPMATDISRLWALKPFCSGLGHMPCPVSNADLSGTASRTITYPQSFQEHFLSLSKSSRERERERERERVSVQPALANEDMSWLES